jgi:hypothetical protein
VNSLVPVIAGFLLTTVLGGILGTWLQQRSWDHQRRVALSEKELESANQVCQQISSLLDKRLYRMLRLYYALRYTTTGPPIEVAKGRLQEYDSVLFEWNDHLNLNLALVAAYFGQDARDWLQFKVYEPCQKVGAQLEALYRHVMSGEPLTVEMADIESGMTNMNEQIYRLGVHMMTQLRSGSVGRAAPNPVDRTTTPAEVVALPPTLPGISWKVSERRL